MASRSKSSQGTQSKGKESSSTSGSVVSIILPAKKVPEKPSIYNYLKEKADWRESDNSNYSDNIKRTDTSRSLQTNNQYLLNGDEKSMNYINAGTTLEHNRWMDKELNKKMNSEGEFLFQGISKTSKNKNKSKKKLIKTVSFPELDRDFEYREVQSTPAVNKWQEGLGSKLFNRGQIVNDDREEELLQQVMMASIETANQEQEQRKLFKEGQLLYNISNGSTFRDKPRSYSVGSATVIKQPETEEEEETDYNWKESMEFRNSSKKLVVRKQRTSSTGSISKNSTTEENWDSPPKEKRPEPERRTDRSRSKSFSQEEPERSTIPTAIPEAEHNQVDPGEENYNGPICKESKEPSTKTHKPSVEENRRKLALRKVLLASQPSPRVEREEDLNIFSTKDILSYEDKIIVPETSTAAPPKARKTTTTTATTNESNPPETTDFAASFPQIPQIPAIPQMIQNTNSSISDLEKTLYSTPLENLFTKNILTKIQAQTRENDDQHEIDTLNLKILKLEKELKRQKILLESTHYQEANKLTIKDSPKETQSADKSLKEIESKECEKKVELSSNLDLNQVKTMPVANLPNIYGLEQAAVNQTYMPQYISPAMVYARQMPNQNNYIPQMPNNYYPPIIYDPNMPWSNVPANQGYYPHYVGTAVRPPFDPTWPN